MSAGPTVTRRHRASSPTRLRHGSLAATFDYLRAFAWRQVVCWLRRKHPLISWKQLRRRYLPG